MELFTPELGLTVWMLVAFLVVFFVLAKFAWPFIIKGVDQRGQFIDDSIRSAKEANERLEGIKEESDKILLAAHEEQLRLLKDATEMRNQIIKEAKNQAEIEAEKVMKEARRAIQKEKDDAIRDIRNQVVELSIQIAEKAIRKNLENKPAQMELINQLLDEVEKAN